MTKNSQIYYIIGKLGLIIVVLWLTWTFSQPILQLYKEYNQPYAFVVEDLNYINQINYSIIGIKPYVDKQDLYIAPDQAKKIELYYTDKHYRDLNIAAIKSSDKLQWLFIALVIIIAIDLYIFGAPTYIKKLIEVTK